MRKVASMQDRSAGKHAKFATYTGYDIANNVLYPGMSAFKTTGSRKERKDKREFLTQHELGHRSLHSLQSNPETRTEKGLELLKKSSPENEVKAKKLIKNTKKNPLQKEREKGIQQSKQYVDKTSPHSNFSEIEADRYGANKTSNETAKKALKDIEERTLTPKEIKHQTNRQKIADKYNAEKEYERVTSHTKGKKWSNNIEDHPTDEGFDFKNTYTQAKLLKAYKNQKQREKMSDKDKRHAELLKKNL